LPNVRAHPGTVLGLVIVGRVKRRAENCPDRRIEKKNDAASCHVVGRRPYFALPICWTTRSCHLLDSRVGCGASSVGGRTWCAKSNNSPRLRDRRRPVSVFRLPVDAISSAHGLSRPYMHTFPAPGGDSFWQKATCRHSRSKGQVATHRLALAGASYDRWLRSRMHFWQLFNVHSLFAGVITGAKPVPPPAIVHHSPGQISARPSFGLRRESTATSGAPRVVSSCAAAKSENEAELCRCAVCGCLLAGFKPQD